MSALSPIWLDYFRASLCIMGASFYSIFRAQCWAAAALCGRDCP